MHEAIPADGALKLAGLLLRGLFGAVNRQAEHGRTSGARNGNEEHGIHADIKVPCNAGDLPGVVDVVPS